MPVNTSLQSGTPDLQTLLRQSEAQHRHLCPRQVLGVRMGMLAARLLSLPMPQQDKRILTIVETDGCFADGVTAATGCSLGHRTMRLADYGKIAATFIDTRNDRAFRIAPLPDLRTRAAQSIPEAGKRWRAYLDAYQRIADEEMFAVREVALNLDIKATIGKPGTRATCAQCAEEIINQREVLRDGRILCPSCAGDSYWKPKS
ncbi:MAG: FmdE family protein [Acidobacteriota bacterium]